MHGGAQSGIDIGDDVHLGRGALIQVHRGGELTVGSRCKLMHFTVIACQGRLSIGADTQVAEHSSVRDAEHGLERHTAIRDQEVIGETRIGSDVWIGRGCAVLMGAEIGDGAVIGANSVVRGPVPSYAIAVGAPARVVRQR